jgi:hypothetical protein
LRSNGERRGCPRGPSQGHPRRSVTLAEFVTERPRPSRWTHPLPAQSPIIPVLRANPFPEVTDLICRLPLPTLFYRLEAVNLGDLLRIWVRAGAKSAVISPGFSRSRRALVDAARTAALWPKNQNPISGERIPGPRGLCRKDNSSQAPAGVSWFVCVATTGTRPERFPTRFWEY